MTNLELDPAPPKRKHAPLPLSEIDFALTAQIIIAWAGEGGEEPRLSWWRSDMVSEFGSDGEDASEARAAEDGP
ncbi:MAG: hypothetical protein Tsb0020_21310 [Haliangiales bacterium]